MMKKSFLGFFASIVFVFGFSTASNAALLSRAGGTMVYDTDLDLTWLADANLAASNTFGTAGIASAGWMNWNTANSWINGMNASNGGNGYLGYNDWRLPTALNQDGTGPCAGYNCSGSEMGHLFYTELGGAAGQSILASTDTDLALFSNLQSSGYWSGTEFASNTSGAWYFSINIGTLDALDKTGYHYAWAVRPGDVVPEPGTMLLLGSGLLGLAVYRKRQDRYIG